MDEHWILVFASRLGSRVDGRVEMVRIDAEAEAMRLIDDEFQVVGIKNLQTEEFVPYHMLVVWQ